MFSFTGSRGSFLGDANFYGKAVSKWQIFNFSYLHGVEKVLFLDQTFNVEILLDWSVWGPLISEIIFLVVGLCGGAIWNC